ncbi:hypothetical protein ACFW5D_11960 [Streptomyces sp. NPDC058770]|uniref:hypothetical protein n=1 Tax=Streptomyces sp. NPDC058770 TaxID=3346631 RepID=UPI003689F552
MAPRAFPGGAAPRWSGAPVERAVVDAPAPAAEPWMRRCRKARSAGVRSHPCTEVLDDHRNGDPFREPAVPTTPPGELSRAAPAGHVVAHADRRYAVSGRLDDGPPRREGRDRPTAPRPGRHAQGIRDEQPGTARGRGL